MFSIKSTWYYRIKTYPYKEHLDNVVVARSSEVLIQSINRKLHDVSQPQLQLTSQEETIKVKCFMSGLLLAL